MNTVENLSKEKAYNVISTLRKGTPPEDGVDLYSVGREELLSYFKKKYNEIKEYGVSDVKFVSADFGYGKSHFLDLLKELALEQNFVVSKVVLHSRDVPFDQMNLVIQGMMANISTLKAKTNGLESLLNEWCEVNRDKSESNLYKSLSDIGIYPEMRMKLVEYFKSYCYVAGPRYQECLQVLKWFEGRETKTKTFSNVRQYLHNLILLIRSIDYKGFIVMLDEAEAITSLSRINRRDLANENIRQVIDNDQDTKGFYFIMASTPTFLSGEDDRGAQSYQALWRRISDPLQGLNQNSLDKVIVDLPKLTEDEFFRLAMKIKLLYEVALGKDFSKINENHLRSLAHYVQTRTDQRVGTMVRSTVAILDAATSQDFDFVKRFELLVEKAMEQEQIDRAL